MLPFKTMISIKEKEGMPIYLQIANGIINQVLNGRIAPGYKMPGTRVFADLMKVHRNTIIASYEELEAQGWLEIVPAKGSFITEKLPLIKARKIASSKSIQSVLKKSSFKLNEHAKSGLDIHRTENSALHFDDGSPDVRIAPINLLARHYKGLLNSPSKHKFDYSFELKGNTQLRTQLKKYLSESRGINVSIKNILITRGSIMGFYLFFKNLIKSGDRVIVGEMSYQPVNQIIRDLGGIIETVAVDKEGLNMEQVERLCKKKNIKALYVIPHHHHPTTVTLSCERRMRLLMLAEKYGFAIVEDDYDFDFHYKSSPILPLMSSDQNGQVVYAGSFSKNLAPAFRLGYVVAPENVIDAMTYTRRYVDRQGDVLMERALAMMIEEGELKRHIRKALIIYKKRRDHLCDLMKTELNGKVNFDIPEGGLTVWTQFDERIDLPRMVEKARKKGLFMVDPKVYNPKGRNVHSSRLGFASMNVDELSQSVAILKKAIG